MAEPRPTFTQDSPLMLHYKLAAAIVSDDFDRFIELLDSSPPDTIHVRGLPKHNKPVPSSQGDMLIHYAVKKKRYKMVQELLKRGANPNFRDAWGLPPLQQAIRDKVTSGNSEKDMVQLLLDAGADPNVRSFDGAAALDHPESLQNAHIVEQLVRAGADIHSGLVGLKVRIPLHQALDLGSGIDVIETLIRLGSDVNQRDHKGRTALHHEWHYGRPDVVALLIKAGADIEAKDNQGLTPLNDYTLRERRAAIKELIRAGVNTQFTPPPWTARLSTSVYRPQLYRQLAMEIEEEKRLAELRELYLIQQRIRSETPYGTSDERLLPDEMLRLIAEKNVRIRNRGPPTDGGGAATPFVHYLL
jgi:ankyrin repeat protein